MTRTSVGSSMIWTVLACRTLRMQLAREDEHALLEGTVLAGELRGHAGNSPSIGVTSTTAAFQDRLLPLRSPAHGGHE